MTATVDEALARAQAEHDHASQDWTGWCQKFVRSMWEVGALYPTAAIAWAHAKHRHTSWPPPPGAPCFWTGGPHGFGHAALSTGQGNIWSTDILRRGEVDHVALSLITQSWGLHYEGWTEDINDVDLPVGYDPSDPGGEVIPPPPTHEEDEPMHFINIVGDPADDKVYGYTDSEWWIATAEEVSAFGGSRQVNARQRDVIKNRVLSIGKLRAETPITDANLEAMRPIIRREATDANGRTFQAWLGGQANQEFDPTEVAAIKAIGARGGVLGDLFDQP